MKKNTKDTIYCSEKLQRARDKWNIDRIKHLDFINKRLQKNSETKVYINNDDKAMFK